MQRNVGELRMEWKGKMVNGELTITHVPSGLIFNTWADAQKWEAYLRKINSDN